jgi:hypothetical protein
VLCLKSGLSVVSNVRSDSADKQSCKNLPPSRPRALGGFAGVAALVRNAFREGKHMIKACKSALPVCVTIVFCAASVFGQTPPEIKVKLDAEIKKLESLSTDTEIVNSVKAHNATPASAEAQAMSNDNWHNLSMLDPFVRAVAKAPLSEYLKNKKKADDTIAKIFVSGADGFKVGFDAKTEHWTHKGLPKHEVPMTGQTWIGAVKLDDSTGQQLIQVGLPVLDGGKPIGSLVVGLRVDKLH